MDFVAEDLEFPTSVVRTETLLRLLDHPTGISEK